MMIGFSLSLKLQKRKNIIVFVTLAERLATYYWLEARSSPPVMQFISTHGEVYLIKLKVSCKLDG